MDKEITIKIINNFEYLDANSLKYNNKLGLHLNNADLIELNKMKEQLIDENNELLIPLPLKSFNSKYLYYCNGNYLSSLINDLKSLNENDMMSNSITFSNKNNNDIYLNRICSEIEGTLRIENIPTTQKSVENIIENKDLTDINQTIIKNMYEGIKYINNKPAFNKENLKKLYLILSKNCLNDNQKLPNNSYYRNDSVIIDSFDGAPQEKISELMDSLFDFVKNTKIDDPYYLLLPHICHYYIVYVHPYFDYNGRCARMVSYWISKLFDIDIVPPFMSEAINENKFKYYKALRDTRLSQNDLTYFIGYIFETAINFYLICKNIENIDKIQSQTGDFLSTNQKYYIKRILMHNAYNYFDYKMFNEYINNNITKQRSLIILNDLNKLNILDKHINNQGSAVFKFNPNYILYKIQ